MASGRAGECDVERVEERACGRASVLVDGYVGWSVNFNLSKDQACPSLSRGPRSPHPSSIIQTLSDQSTLT